MSAFLDWPEGKLSPPHPAAVANELRALLDSFPDYFDGYPATPEDKDDLLRIAEALEQQPPHEPERLRANEHRQTSYKSTSPIYAALDPDPSFVSAAAGLTPEPDQQALERLGRLLLLLSSCEARTLSASTINTINIFCRNLPIALMSVFGSHIKPIDRALKSRYLEIQAGALPYIENRDWAGLGRYLKEIETKGFNESWKNRLENLEIIVAELIAIQNGKSKRAARKNPTQSKPDQDAEKERKKRKQRIKRIITGPPKEVIPGIGSLSSELPEDEAVPTTTSHPDSEVGPPTATLLKPRKTTRTAELPDKALEKITVRGNQLRFRSIWSGQSVEALTPREASLCMDALLRYPASDDFQEIARILLILSGLSGKMVNNLLVGFDPPLEYETPNPKLILELAQDKLVITQEAIGCSEFASMPDGPLSSGLVEPVAQSLRSVIDLTQICKDPSVLQTIHSINSLESVALKGIINEINTLVKYLRNNITDRFTQHRWRSTIIHELVRDTSDLPLAQLILCEDLGYNASAQHYIARHCNQIDVILKNAQRRMWGDLLRHPVSIEGSGWVGAPWGGQGLGPIRSVSRQLQAVTTTDKEAFDGAVPVEYHNTLVDWVAWLVMISTASRNNRDFNELRLDQISLSAGLLIYTDKPADPSIYRRLAAIPTFVKAEILRLLHHYVQLRNYLRRFAKHKSEYALTKEIDAILRGEASLFTRLDIGKKPSYPTSAPSPIVLIPWRAKDFIARFLPESYPRNFSRSLFASQARHRELLSPFLIEAQLGHVFGTALFADDSVISPTEYASALNTPLTQYLGICGVDTTEQYTPPAHAAKELTPLFEPDQILKGIKSTREADTKLIREQRGLTSSGQKDIKTRDVINRVLKDHLGLAADDNMPKEVNLDQSECKLLSTTILDQISGDERTLLSALRQLRNRLRELKTTHNWDLELPPPVFWHIQSPIRLTKYHLQASELLTSLQSSIADILALLPPNKIHEATALYLVSFDFVPTFEKAWEILSTKPTPYQVDKTECWGLDIKLGKKSELYQGRFFTKAAIIALDASFKSPLPVPELKNFRRDIHLLLPECLRRSNAYRLSELNRLETIVQLSRLVRCPQLISDAVSGTLLQRELTAKRTSELYSDSGNNAYLPEPASKDVQTGSQPLPKSNPGQFQNEIEFLKQQLAHSNTKKRPARSAPSKLKELLHGGCHPNTALLIHWALRLLGPTANLKSGGWLRARTVNKYVNSAATVLIESVGETYLGDLDEEEIYELVSETLDNAGWVDAHKHLNRFFDDMHERSGLPNLHFKGDRKAIESIDANIITPHEHKYAIGLLNHWSRQADMTPAEQSAIQEAAYYIDIAFGFGTRRSELQFARGKDFNRNTGILAIRHNQTRTIKTTAANRIIQIDKAIPDLNATLPANDEPLLFHHLNRKDIRLKPLELATQALRQATGNEKARLHHYRHSIATNNVHRILDEVDLTLRWKQAAELSTKLGHASLRTTISHYTHNATKIFTLKYAGNKPRAIAKALRFFLGQPTQVNKAKRQSFRTIKKTLQTPSRSTGSYSKTNLLPLPISMSADERGLASATITMFEKMIGGYANIDSAEIVISASEMAKVLTLLKKIQYESDFEAIPASSLEIWLEGTASHRSQKGIRRNLPAIAFESWRANLEGTSDEDALAACADLASYKSGIRWRKRPVRWYFAPEDRDHLEKTIRETGLPIDLKETPDRENYVILTLQGTEQAPANAATTVRCLLQFALALSSLKTGDS